MRFARVCVYAGSASGANAEYAEASRAIVTELARRGSNVVYGGGSLGLMGVLVDAALEGGGEVTGVIPRFLAARAIGPPGGPALRRVD